MWEIFFAYLTLLIFIDISLYSYDLYVYLLFRSNLIYNRDGQLFKKIDVLIHILYIIHVFFRISRKHNIIHLRINHLEKDQVIIYFSVKLFGYFDFVVFILYQIVLIRVLLLNSRLLITLWLFLRISNWYDMHIYIYIYTQLV